MPLNRGPTPLITASVAANVTSVSQRGRKRSLKKYYEIDAVADTNAVTSSIRGDSEKRTNEVKPDSKREKEWHGKEQKNSSMSNSSNDKTLLSKSNSKSATTSSSLLDMGKTSDDTDAQHFQFDIRFTQLTKNIPRKKIFHCIVCDRNYQQLFSVKRHFIRSHISMKYISNADALNCNITIGQYQAKKEALNDDKDSEDEESVVEEDSVVEENMDENEKEMIEQTIKDSDSQDICTDMKDVEVQDDFTNDPKRTDIDERISADDPCVKSDTLNLEVDEIPEASPPESCHSPQSSLLESLEDDLQQDLEDISLGKKQSLPGLYRCNICENLYDAVEELKEHYVNHPENRRFACAHCKMSFRYQKNLMHHEVVHSGEIHCSFK